jgi:hypothetical protein
METLRQIHRSITNSLSLVGWSLVEVISPRAENMHELEQLATFYAQALS